MRKARERRGVRGAVATVAVAAVVVVVSGCSTGVGNQNGTDAETYTVGETGPAGGIVFYDKGDYSDGWRYLEAWTGDEDLFYQWKTETISTPGTSTDVGSGYANTYSAMTGTEYPAAEAVRNATHGGYDDWFLPSKGELNLMYQNLHQEGIGGFAVHGYWSSSEYSSDAAWNQGFDNTGDQYDYGKEYGDKVRAARAF